MSDDEQTATRFKEFDCPECTANNPLDDGFKVGDEIQCMYCGLTFKVRQGVGSKFRLEET